MAMPVRMAEVPGPSSRVTRNPQHHFQIRSRPWQIAPFLIAPVLPGETLKHALHQSRVVTDPVKSPLVGWWCEYMYYYVKHRDLDGRDTFSAMMLDPTTSLTAFNQAALVEYYHSSAGISWVKECLKRVTEYYFRTGDEAWDAATIGNLPSAKIMQRNLFDSAENDTDRAAVADVNVDLNANSTITASEVDQAMWQWQLLRTQGMTNLSYEDYLRSFGVRAATADLHKPELLRHIRTWSAPVNHIDPTDGSPTSAVVWKVQESLDKDRFFKEPGFIFGVCVMRPKVYLSRQAGAGVDLLTDLYRWVPAVLRQDINASIIKLPAFSANLFGGDGATTGNADAVWIDVKDLFLYGDQFVNFALTATDAGLVALPTAALEKRYASSTDADALFASASPSNQIRQEGVCSLSIATAMQDTTQSV